MDLYAAMEHVDCLFLLPVAVTLLLALVGWIVLRSIPKLFFPPRGTLSTGSRGGMGDGTGAAVRRVGSSGCETTGGGSRKVDGRRVHDEAFPFAQEITCLFYFLCGIVVSVYIVLYLVFSCIRGSVVEVVSIVVRCLSPEDDDEDAPEVSDVQPEVESREEAARRVRAELIERRRLVRMKIEWMRREEKMRQTASGRHLLQCRAERVSNGHVDTLRTTLLKSRCGEPWLRGRFERFG